MQETTYRLAYRDVLTGAPALMSVSARHADRPGVVTAAEADGITAEQLEALTQTAERAAGGRERAARRRGRRRARDMRRVITNGVITHVKSLSDIAWPAQAWPTIRVENIGEFGQLVQVYRGGEHLGDVEFEPGDGTSTHVWRIVPLSCVERASHWGLPWAGTRQEAIDALINGDYTL